jgi:hypothetical protein
MVGGREVSLTHEQDGTLVMRVGRLEIPATWEVDDGLLRLNLPSRLGGRFGVVKDEDTVSLFDTRGLRFFRFDYSRD